MKYQLQQHLQHQPYQHHIAARPVPYRSIQSRSVPDSFARSRSAIQQMRRILCVFLLCGFIACSMMNVVRAIEGQPTASATTATSPTESSASPPLAETLVISELQTGSCIEDSIGGFLDSTEDATDSTRDSARQCTEQPAGEFVELYNPSANDLPVAHWKVRYLPASGNTGSQVVLADLNGVIAAHRYVLIAHATLFPDGNTSTQGTASESTNPLGPADTLFGAIPDNKGKLAKTGGHVEILDQAGTVIDRIGWGSAQQPWGQAAKPYPGPGESLERKADTSGYLVHSGNNDQDFEISSIPSPQGGGYKPIPDPAIEQPAAPQTGDSDSDSGDGLDAGTDADTTCADITITELLPNPSGSDTGLEYIELHNPTQAAISLSGCSLQVSGSSKVFVFDSTSNSLAPGAYTVFSNAATGLTLPNSSGGTVWLLSPTDELQAVTYPGDLDDDVVWAFADGTWAASYTPTPGQPNLITPLKPCLDGQIRNIDTNRCVTTSSSTATSDATDNEGHVAGASTTADTPASPGSTLNPCPAGKERNPATNRCRTIASVLAASSATAASTSKLTPCKPGQERNPETNRCRAASASATSSTNNLKPCPEGQERNPETNRCRKAIAAGSSATGGPSLDKVEDIATNSTSANKPYWLIGLIVLGGIVAYAVYEWRQEIALAFSKIRARLGGLDTSRVYSASQKQRPVQPITATKLPA